MIKVKTISAICIILTISFSGCKHDIEDKINEMMSSPINLSMFSNVKQACDYKLISVYDSTVCSRCVINRIHEWNYWADTLSKYNTSIHLIFCPKVNDKDFIKATIEKEDFAWCTYIDSCYSFFKANPRIPQDPRFHTFLVNDNDSVILVGNPTRNQKIEELMFTILRNSKEKKGSGI